MASNIAFTVIKPDAVAAGRAEDILRMMDDAGFRIMARRELILTNAQAGELYAVHFGKPFYEGLVEFMTSGPVVVAVLEKENAVAALRGLAGATDPAEAAEGTIRRVFGETVRRNAVHVSDSDDNVMREASLFFSPEEMLP